MTQIVLFLNGSNFGGTFVELPNNISDLLQYANQLFQIEALHLYTCQGIVLNDLETLINNQVLFVSGGEPFVPPQAEKHNSVVRHSLDDQWVRLNVGGTYFTTTKTTLLKESGSVLAKMFDDNQVMKPSKEDEVGAYLFDRNPAYFSVILDYLRDGIINIGDKINRYAILNEATFFGIDSLVQNIKMDQLGLVRTITIEELKTVLDINSEQVRANVPMTKTNFEGLELPNLAFCGINLEGSSFFGCTMARVKFKNCNIQSCDFRETDLLYSVFLDSQMANANFSNANMRRATLKSNKIDGANFTGANLSVCKIMNCTFDKSIFDDANLKCSEISRCLFNETAMQGVNFVGAKFINSSFVKAYLPDADFQQNMIKNCDMSWANLANSKFTSLSLNGSNFSNACLRGAKLDGNIMYCKLQRAVFKNANMSSCNLTECVLDPEDVKNYESAGVLPSASYCIMRDTNLSGSTLKGCNLSGSYLIGANFSGANVTDVIIEEWKRPLLLKMTN